MSAPVEKKKGVLSAFAPFPKPFWVINGVELFERGAYYGMLAVLSTFLIFDLGLPAELAGILLAIQFPLLYFLPVFSGALADKVGFKRLLVASFVFLIAGYAVISIAATFTIGLVGVVLYGIGAGLFKPMPAATVSDTTSEADRNFGFAIYYWMINLGAFLAPLGMIALFGGSYRPYFMVSAGLSVINLVICLTVWKDIRIRRPEIKLSDSVRSIGGIFQHKQFLGLITIYCGFWFMYAITTSFLQAYAREYGILTPAQVGLIVPANALAILLVGPVLAKLTGKANSLTLMIAGITIFCSGFVLIGFVATMWALLAGVFIYSIGEFLTHPSYLSYVTKIAPADKVPIFLGYGFLPIGVGQFLGTLSGGFLYGAFAQGANARPQMFWVAIVSIGMLTVAALLVYNYLLTSKARRDVAPGPGEPSRRRAGGVVGTFGLALLAILAVPALLAAATMAPVAASIDEAGDDPLDSASLGLITLPEMEGEVAEGETHIMTVTLADGATGAATFALTWQDETPSTPTGSNAPDSFILHVVAPDGTRVSSEEVDTGSIELVLDAAVPGDYTLEIELVNAGDITAVGNPLGLPIGSSADTGNAFTMSGSYQSSAA